MIAIAAMSRQGRVIGRDNRTPWHLPEEIRWFQETTMGGTVLMGRKTFEAIGRPLPGRLNLIATRGPLPPEALAAGAQAVPDLGVFDPAGCATQPVWVIGGQQVYAQLLPRCREVLLTLVDSEAAGDAYMPPFESGFPLREPVRRGKDFEIIRYRRGPGFA